MKLGTAMAANAPQVATMMKMSLGFSDGLGRRTGDVVGMTGGIGFVP
jgi:hypothetical protein